MRDSSDSFIRHGTPRHASGQLIVGSKGTTFNGVVIAAGQLLSHLIEFSLSFSPLPFSFNAFSFCNWKSRRNFAALMHIVHTYIALVYIDKAQHSK